MKPILLLIVALQMLAVPLANANIGPVYGFGARTAALAGASTAYGFEGFGAYDNPAAVSLRVDQLSALEADSGRGPAKPRRLILSWGLVDMQPSFKPINHVDIENNYVSDKSPPVTGSVDTSYRAAFGQEIGLNYELFPEFHQLSFGFTAFIPITQLAYLDTGESFLPEYILYRSRTLVPQFDFALSGDLGSGWHLGAGAQLAYSITSTGTVFIQTTPGLPSTLRLASSIKPKLQPYVGLLWMDSADFSAGLVFRAPLKSTNELSLQSGARALGDAAALDVALAASSAISYDPLTLEAGLSWKYNDASRLYAQVDYEGWSHYVPPALNIGSTATQTCDGAPCLTGISANPSNNPQFAYKDLWIPRIADEWDFGPWILRAGYAYRGSILSSVPNGVGNYLDPPVHMLTAGVGFRFRHFLNFDVPCNIDLNGAYHMLVTQTITKTSGNEVGNLSDSKIGSPGYQAGGSVYGGGLTLTLAF